MGLFLKVNRLDFFVPKERARGFAIVSSVDAIRAPKASSSATRPGQALGYFYLDAKLPSLGAIAGAGLFGDQRHACRARSPFELHLQPVTFEEASIPIPIARSSAMIDDVNSLRRLSQA